LRLIAPSRWQRAAPPDLVGVDALATTSRGDDDRDRGRRWTDRSRR
jgi:hypothetical protein